MAHTFSHNCFLNLCLQRILSSFRITGVIFPHYVTALFSEAWRDELKELVTKVSVSSQEQKDKKEVRVLIC